MPKVSRDTVAYGLPSTYSTITARRCAVGHRVTSHELQ